MLQQNRHYGSFLLVRAAAAGKNSFHATSIVCEQEGTYHLFIESE